ncbi:MAG: TonB-dependent receptor [Prevotella sp.]|jgi:TonB-linked SusC/RagA family outer membrane protein|nr:TonB-dependent receptor [Prevotella sp.]MCH4018785.1 TonB-dependent receptor [Prevotella sp.]MCI1324577.1 TonB-dependent receptor [Prevotella sp.]MCI1416216.1 TonB-dependent receptor [Prevotella sp.]MCI1450892.1 TonB-dependent receptor [Prevotella sp.]
MRKTRNNFGFLYNYKRAIICLVLGVVGIELDSIMAAPKTMLSSLSAESVQQNTITVEGMVKDAKGDPIIGVSIIEKGASGNGTVTDMDGHFKLNVHRGSILSFSYVGFLTQNVLADKVKNIILKENLKSLNEVVVIGYGTQRKGDVTSAITTVKSDDFLDGKIGDAAELIKGKVAGLSIVNTSGDPNSGSSIMLRGITTIKGSVEPLVLVDGIEADLATVATDNIASIDVLKDASAAAIYGTRGANGVIIITTKTGRREAKPEIIYHAYMSLSNWYKKTKFMDADDINSGYTNFSYEGYNTNWLKAVTRKAGFEYNHSLSVRGGGKNNTYSGNVTYSDDQGIMRKSESRDLRMQLDLSQYAFNDMLKFNLNILHGQHKNPNNDNTYVYRQALIHNPSSPIYNSDGSYYEEFSRYQYYNPIEIQNEMIGDTRSNYTQLTGNVSFEPIRNWITNLMISRREDTSTSETYYTDKYYSQQTSGCNGWASKSSDNGRSDNLELTSKYALTIGNHRMSVLAGYSYLYNVYDGFSAGNGNFPAQFFLYNNLAEGTYLTDNDETASMSSYKNDNTLIGFFGRLTYAWSDLYNVMVSLRHEGSSKFGENHKWGTFPAASIGWTISNEKFMKRTHSWLDNLRLRVGYGVTGVIPTDSYMSLTLYSYDTYGKHYDASTGSWKPSLYVTQNSNPDLKWETSRELNIGIDWSVFSGRLSGTVDLYNKKTVDLLYDYNVPVPPNLYGTTTANVGKMRNTGIEVTINASLVKAKKIQWETSLTFSHNSNKLLSLSNSLYETNNFVELYGGLSDPISVPTHCMEVGHRLGDFWGLKSVGVSSNGVVIVQVKDDNGNWVNREFDTKYNTKSNRQRLGNGLPQLIAGWSHTIRYKDFDLQLQFTGQFGYKILNEQRCFYENNSIAYNRLKSSAKYYPAVDLNLNPVLDANGNQLMVQYSSSMSQGFWSGELENGDFVKLQTATFGYTVPLSQYLKKYINKLRVYLTGNNLFCITSYSGLDPEVSNSFLTPGIDSRDKYPTVRSFTLGMNITF